MSADAENPLLRPGALDDHEAAPELSPALAALLTHPVHEHDLRNIPEVGEALEIVRAELARAQELPPLPPPPLPDPARIVRLLGF